MSDLTKIDVPTEGAADSFEAAMAAATGQAPAPEVSPQQLFQGFVPPSMKQPEPTPAPEAQAATTEPAATTAAPPAPSAKELERIAALDARETKLREREAALQAEARAREEQSARDKATTERQWAQFKRNPVAFVRSMRPDLTPSEAAEVAEHFYVHTLGDKAPADVRQRMAVTQETTEVRSEVDQLRAEIEELRAARAREEAEAERAKYRSELREGAAKVATSTPIVASLLQRKPDAAAQMLFEVARRAAIESRERGEAPVVMTAEQAATALERVLAAQHEEYYGTPWAPAQAPITQAAPPSPTLTNRDASVRPGRAITDPDDDAELRRAALKAAGLEHLWWE